MSGKTSSARLTFLVLSAAAAAFSMLQSLVSPVLSTIQHDLRTSPATVTWVLTAWLLSASVATPLMGRIGDMIGKERTLLVALGAIAVGCLVAALAPNIGVLVVARVIQGLGGAVFPVSFGIIRDEFPAARVPSAVGVLSAVIAAGGGLGIVLSGPIVASLGWRWLFWVPMIVVTATAVLAHRYVPESPVRSPGRIDWFAASAMTSLIVQNVPAGQTGAASGMNANIRTIGGSIGTAVVSSIIIAHPRPDGLPHESGFTHGFLLLTLTSAVTVALALLVPSARRKAEPAPVADGEPLVATH